MKNIYFKPVAGIVVGIAVAGAALSVARAVDSTLNQVINGYDCSHATLATSGTLNDVNCAEFPPSVQSGSSATGSPVIVGVYDAVHAAGLTVTFNGKTYVLGVDAELIAVANKWTLDLDTLSPALSPGTYPVNVSMTSTSSAVLTGAGTVTILPVTLPTVNPVTWVGGAPILSGTYDPANTETLKVQIDGVWYELGVDDELTANGSTWQLDLGVLTPPLGVGAYDIKVELTTKAGQVLTDATLNELTIKTEDIVSVITHPTTGPLARTGSSAWWLVVISIGVSVAGIAGIVWSRFRKRQESTTM